MVIKSLIARVALALAIGIFSYSWAGSVKDSAPGYNTDPLAAAPMNPATSPAAPNTKPSPDTSKNDTDSTDSTNTTDDTLYRTKTKDSLAAGAMSRDEGQLTAKPRRRERVLEVDSTKKLPTSGTDPKFQGSLLHSSVTSIDFLGEKANQNADAEQQQQPDDPRFTRRHRVFTQQATDESKKKESAHTEADSSPSPSPSPSPSASPSAPSR